MLYPPKENEVTTKFYALLFAVVLSALAGCASTPDKIVSVAAFSEPTATSSAPAALPPLPVQITDPGLVKKLKADAANLDQALAIGALPANDPAAPCLHDFMRRAGVEQAPGTTAAQSFKPDPDGDASIVYILAQQAKLAAAAGNIQISQSCLALVGQIHLDAIAVAAKGARGLLGLGGIGSVGGLGGLIIPGVGLIKTP